MLSNTIRLKCYSPILLRDFYEQANHIRGPRTNFYCFSTVLEQSFSNLEKYIGARTMYQKESGVWTVNQQETTWTAKKFSRYISKKCYFSHMFSPKPWEMALATSHQRSILKIRKPGEVVIFYKNQERLLFFTRTRRGCYFLQELLIFVQIFELYLVTQFLSLRSGRIRLYSYVLTRQILLSYIPSLVVFFK